MALTDWLAVVSAVAAATGLVFTAEQARLARRDFKATEVLSVRGVAVSWLALEAPDCAEADGSGEWVYEIKVHNPGRLPIDDVRVQLHLPLPVRRVRYSGRVGEPTDVLTMLHPVLIGGESRVWKRRIRLEFACAERLKESFAEVQFRDARLRAHSLRWPR